MFYLLGVYILGRKMFLFIKKFNICNSLFLRFLHHNKICSFLMNLQFLNEDKTVLDWEKCRLY